MPTKRFAFNVKLAIPQAWDLIWSDNLKQQADGKGYNPGQFYYVTASDLENQVRTFADETAEGKAWGSTGRAWGRYPTGVRLSGNLQKSVRDWLFSQVSRGKLQVHNFGKGHVSGARFRPMGAPLADSEKQTFERKQKERVRTDPKPVHFRLNGGAGCVQIKKKGFSFSRPSRSTRVTNDLERVTCPRCVKFRGEFQKLVDAKKKREADRLQGLRDEGKLIPIEKGTEEQLKACGENAYLKPTVADRGGLLRALTEAGYREINLCNEHYVFATKDDGKE